MANTKKWWKSKTIRVMALAIIASLISGLASESWMDGEIQTMLLSIAGIILRKYTSSGLEK